MKVGTKVRIVDHADYEVQRVGAVGEVKKVEEKDGQQFVYVMFDQNAEELHEYPFEAVVEAEQKQIGKGGKEGLPDTSKPTPPQMDTSPIDDLDGEQKQVDQANSSESRPQPGSAQTDGVSSEQIVLNGETPQLDGYPAGTGGRGKQSTRPETGSAQTAGVTGQQLELNDEQNQLDQVPPREKVKGVKDSARRKPQRKVEGAFNPITVRVLDESDEPDSYMEIGGTSSIRNEQHLTRSIRGAVRKALESMQQPFDAVDIIFRRNPKLESARRVAERKLIGSLHLVAEGKARVIAVKEAAQRAAKLGIKPSTFKAYATDAYTVKVLESADRIVEGVGTGVQMVWPPKNLDSCVGKQVIIDTVTKDRWVGTLEKAQVKEGQTGTKRMYQIKMSTGRKVFGPNDVSRILVKKGAK